MKKRVLTLFLAAAIVLTSGCARKQEAGGESATDNTTAQEVQEEEAPRMIEVRVPSSSSLVNKVLNLPSGSGTVTIENTVTFRGQQVDARITQAAFQKGEEATCLEGELAITHKEGEVHPVDLYLVKKKGKKEQASSASAEEEETKSRYELYLFDDTDDTWELEVFNPVLVTTARMTGKRMVAEDVISYRAPDGTERTFDAAKSETSNETESSDERFEVEEENPGEFILRATLDTSQVLSFLEDFDVKEAVKSFTQKPEDNVVIADIDQEMLRKLLEENKDTVTQFITENKDTVQQFLEEHGDELQQYLEEGGTAAKEFITENKDTVQQFLEEHGDELQQYLEEGGSAAKEFITENKDTVVKNAEQLVQGVKDYGYLRQLLAIEEKPQVEAAFDASTLELKSVTISLDAAAPAQDTELYLTHLLITIQYDNHEVPQVHVPDEVLAAPEEKEQGMIFHRVMEELERISK